MRNSENIFKQVQHLALWASITHQSVTQKKHMHYYDSDFIKFIL